MNKQSYCPESILHLVECYEFHRDKYLNKTYNEKQLRQDYVDSFFLALGWDVYNKQGLSEAYKEVANDDPIRMRDSILHTDYAIRIGGGQKFVVMVRKPLTNLYHDDNSALQPPSVSSGRRTSLKYPHKFR